MLVDVEERVTSCQRGCVCVCECVVAYSVGVPNCTYSTKRNVKVNARWRLDGPGTCTEVIYF